MLLTARFYTESMNSTAMSCVVWGELDQCYRLSQQPHTGWNDLDVWNQRPGGSISDGLRTTWTRPLVSYKRNTVTSTRSFLDGEDKRLEIHLRNRSNLRNLPL